MLDQPAPVVNALHTQLHQAIAQIEQIILGKPRQIRLAVCCLLSSGHCLIEDLPGVGKTTLAQAIAAVFGLDFTRIQFTSDLLPADILGVSIFNNQEQCFRFHPGPIFSNCVLADELNRATPKTQSALLEAMEERQITIEGETRPLGQPFFVIGTQNPLDQSGTFPLPESQLDRFMMRLNLGYPDKAAERRLLEGQSRDELLKSIVTTVTIDEVKRMQESASSVHVSPALLDYVQVLVDTSRNSDQFVYGLSPRAALALLNAARSWAYLDGRDFVQPDDIKTVFPAIAVHRLVSVDHLSKSVEQLIDDLLADTAIP